jgi:hypothetical protein
VSHAFVSETKTGIMRHKIILQKQKYLYHIGKVTQFQGNSSAAWPLHIKYNTCRRKIEGGKIGDGQ